MILLGQILREARVPRFPLFPTFKVSLLYPYHRQLWKRSNCGDDGWNYRACHLPPQGAFDGHLGNSVWGGALGNPSCCTHILATLVPDELSTPKCKTPSTQGRRELAEGRGRQGFGLWPLAGHRPWRFGLRLGSREPRLWITWVPISALPHSHLASCLPFGLQSPHL